VHILTATTPVLVACTDTLSASFPLVSSSRMPLSFASGSAWLVRTPNFRCFMPARLLTLATECHC
jgi:hypothetical protein